MEYYTDGEVNMDCKQPSDPIPIRLMILFAGIVGTFALTLPTIFFRWITERKVSWLLQNESDALCISVIALLTGILLVWYFDYRRDKQSNK